MDNNNKFHVDTKDILGILQTSVEQGFSIESLLEQLGLSPKLLDDPLASISLADSWRIISAHESLIQEETHLMSARPLKSGTTRLVFSNLSRCSNLKEGLEQLADTYNVVHGGNYNFVKKRGDTLSLIVDDKEFHYRQQANDFAIEFALIKIHCVLTYLIGGEIKPVKLCTKRAPMSSDAHHLGFFNCGINFGHSHYELSYSSSEYLRPFRPITELDISARLLDDYLAITVPYQPSMAGARLVNSVENAIKQGGRNQSTAAKSMGMSVPTLRRKLKFYGTNFRCLVDKVNSELAINDLRDRVPLDDIAEKLDFCDVRSFKRAFKRWHGISPAVFLEQSQEH